MDVRERLRAAWRLVREKLERRPAGTEGQQEQVRETEVSLGLMAQAAAAGADMTPEQQIMLSQSEHGMRNRLSVLLGIPHRSLAQEREKLAIEGWLSQKPASLDAEERDTPRVQGFAAIAAANPLLALATNPLTWAAAAVALSVGSCSVQTARLNNAKGDLEDARADLAMTERSLVAAREAQERLASAVREADAQTQQTAATIEHERALRLRAQREAQRIRHAQEQARAGEPSIDYGFGGMQHPGGNASGPGSGGAAAGDPERVSTQSN